ncbi:sugar transferase [Parasphingorhabdus sp.]|uniref:sugar transferase n=1 Tax=Parasphingorhabdus sp. TaxID=2709688 RepID=UPI003A8F7976
MKIVITGASGFVGQLLVPRLAKRGIDLLLVGRNQKQMEALFPDFQTCDYDQMEALGKGADILLHLAVANTNSNLSDAEYQSVNVDFLMEIAARSRAAGIRHFINASSIHALDETNSSVYARSKRAGIHALSSLDGIKVHTIYLAAVYGERWAGKLAILNRLPNSLAGRLFLPIAALKPTLHVDAIVDYLLGPFAVDGQEYPVILSDDKSDNPFYSGTKRLIDLMFVLLVTVFMGWMMLLVWIAIKLTSSGPGVFKQVRVGRNTEPFTCYKFRTMKIGTKQLGTHEVSSASVTKLGAFLRKTKIDELPQIINILRNELSLIGPRPCLPNQEELIGARKHLGVFRIKPGISGLAQINNIDMSTPELLSRWDARYIALRGLIPDLSIAAATATGKGQGDKII